LDRLDRLDPLDRADRADRLDRAVVRPSASFRRAVESDRPVSVPIFSAGDLLVRGVPRLEEESSRGVGCWFW
jgi:hypothetical protein